MRFRGAPTQPLVLVIEPMEDSPYVRQSLASTLSNEGFRTIQSEPRASEVARAAGHEPDLVLLDVCAGVDGVDLAGRVHRLISAPIIALLDREREAETSAVLDAGATDYLVKPFVPSDLLGRMRVRLRETTPQPPTRPRRMSRSSRIRIDPEHRALFVEGREVHITPIERKLLLALARATGSAVSEDSVVAALWGPGKSSRAPYLRALVRQLRDKMERDPGRPRHLVSDGTGYRLKLS